MSSQRSNGCTAAVNRGIDRVFRAKSRGVVLHRGAVARAADASAGPTSV
jgi:hypothetical protein